MKGNKHYHTFYIYDKDLLVKIFDIDNHFFEFVNSKGENIFLLDEEHNISWFNHEYFWEVLQTKYSVNYDDIQSIIKDMVEHTYKINIGIPYSDNDNIDK